MKYKKSDWRTNSKLGLYISGCIEDIRKYDHMAIYLADRCRLVVYTWTSGGVTDWENALINLNTGRGTIYWDDPSDIPTAILEGKIHHRTTPDNERGFHHNIFPNEDYFYLCVKPLILRFTLDELYAKNDKSFKSITS